MIHHYIVYTPSFTSYRGVWGDPPEPPEYGADVVEVIAKSKREAKVEAVRKMRAEGMEWVRGQESDGASPFTGLKVEDMKCKHGICHCRECGGDCETCYQEATEGLDGS